MVKRILEIAIVGINYRCPHCNLVISLGTDEHPLGKPFTCFCKREVLIDEDTVFQISQLDCKAKLLPQ